MDLTTRQKKQNFALRFVLARSDVEPRPNGSVLDLDARFQRARRFLAAKGGQGLRGVTGPRNFGRLRRAPKIQQHLLQEQAKVDVPTMHGSEFFSVGITYAAALFSKCATDGNAIVFFLAFCRAEEIWCQVFRAIGRIRSGRSANPRGA